jgi:hypothetical protein
MIHGRLKFAPLLPAFVLLFAVPLAAGTDWVALKSPRVAPPKGYQLSLGVAHSVLESWALGDHFAYLRETDGIYKQQRRVDLDLDFGWQWNQDWGLKLNLPYVLTEFSPFPPPGTIQDFQLNDPTLRRTDSVGDLSLELRRAWGPEADVAGLAAGVFLGVAAPTGIGPFEASSTMAATGQGRWGFQPGFLLSYRLSDWTFAMQGSGLLQLGRESTLSSAASLGFNDAGPLLAPGGNAWLGPRYGVQGAAGLAWEWYAGTDGRHSVALEFSASQRSPLDVGGQGIPDTEEVQGGFIPQLQSQIGRFHALAAWSLPLLIGNNVLSSFDGGSHLRVDYEF